jgi:hypothetical protein
MVWLADYGLDDSGFDFQQGQGVFLFLRMSRLVLQPNQPPVQWVQGGCISHG